MEVKAQKCREKLAPKGGELCDMNKCTSVCKNKHGPLAAGRCMEVDTCYCEYAGSCASWINNHIIIYSHYLLSIIN